jgi:pyruvate dehydrogenase E2 component (dihydrolipoamide acetyltransferase)
MGMQEGRILRWLKQVGEPVQEGEPLVEIEAEKVEVEVPCPQSGILARIVVDVDETVPVREVIAIIMSPEEAAASPPVNSAKGGSDRANAEEPRTVAVSASGEAAAVLSSARPGVQVTPLARRVASENGVDLREVQGTGPRGRITDGDVRRAIEARSAAPSSGRVAAVQVEPRARRLAQEHGIDLSRVRGSGPNGRIVEADVRGAVELTAASATAPGEPIILLAGKHGVIARRMVESLHAMAQLTLNTEANVTALVSLRESLKNEFDLTYTDLLVKAVALALRKHPRLNASVIGQKIHLHADIHIGVAVALDDGLIVPVVRAANRKALKEIAQENRVLAERARSGKLTPNEVSGGTFTLTNLGNLGIDSFTPIINPPQAAILGIGRIVERIARRGADLVWQQVMTLSLTFDHRVIDGAPAAAFLQTVCEFLASPETLIQ